MAERFIMQSIAMLFVVSVIVGCGARKEKAESTSSPAVNADPKGNLEKIYLAWRTCESKNNFAPEEGGMFDKYLKEHGDPREILKGIGIRWAIDTRKVSNRQTLIAWQEKSKDGKYLALFASGKIDSLDENEMDSRGVTVGKNRERSDKLQQDNVRQWLKENEESWAQTKKNFEEDEKKDDAYEQQLKKPVTNPAAEELRKRNLPELLKALVQRRESRRIDFEAKRKVYEEQKKKFQEQLNR